MYPLSTIPPEAFQDDPAAGDGVAGEAMLQDTSKQRGAFVEVKGWGDVLEGESRRESPSSRPPSRSFPGQLIWRRMQRSSLRASQRSAPNYSTPSSRTTHTLGKKISNRRSS